MKVDGKKLAAQVLKDVAKDVKRLKKKKIAPQLAVVLIGSNPASQSYVKQKIKAGAQCGIKVSLHHYKKTPSYQKIAEFIKQLKEDKNIHGIIIQRPVPTSLSAQSLCKLVGTIKDVDGFLPKSIHTPPLGLAVIKVCHHIYFELVRKIHAPKLLTPKPLLTTLKAKNIVLIGRGETGGQPIAETLRSLRLHFVMLHSQSMMESYLHDADIIISAVGKSDVLNPALLKPDVWLLGIGVHREKDQLTGDYNEAEIVKKCAFYTPTPGGMGPINVAYLMHNVVTAAGTIHK
ncbi:bifunctional 5,10-methylenetetrahydrofolate dehydrogenase/5,10-methenyltetrahydrofolate cyclohydrolase [Candidatus Microgenomates bacterium]|nr:MAG: bifunctional 5,10-methylenetetrahydrofolate dehydrogenase/5,10-methenyltetrahydrofolate cyclohydrolase [Candidatus Microgenomates bacterium]